VVGYLFHIRLFGCSPNDRRIKLGINSWLITGPPYGPVLFCSLASVGVICRCQ